MIGSSQNNFGTAKNKLDFKACYKTTLFKTVRGFVIGTNIWTVMPNFSAGIGLSF